jgi:hypothetical protein
MKPLPETFPIRFGRDMPNTIKDVACLAGVSVTTAHRGLTGKGELSEEKRQRVLAAAKQLNFVPSSAARALDDAGIRDRLHNGTSWWSIGRTRRSAATRIHANPHLYGRRRAPLPPDRRGEGAGG